MTTPPTERVVVPAPTAPPAARPHEVLLAVLSLAVLGGWGEAVQAMVGRYLTHRFTHRDPRIIWMAPVSMLIVFALPALLLALGARLRRTWPWWRWSIALCGAVVVFDLLKRLETVHPLALALVAAGVGVQLGALAERRAGPVRRALPRVAAALLGITLLGGVALAAGERLREARRLAALPAAPAGAPNVILVVLDAVRASALSAYGNARPTTPTIDRLAREGVAFRRATSPASWTLPSHASLLTGRWAYELSSDWRVPLDARYPTLAEVLSAHGYRTAGFIANYRYTSSESGLSRGMAHYDDFLLRPSSVFASSNLGEWILFSVRYRLLKDFDDIARKWSPSVREELVDWLARQDARRPFFAFLNFYDAHDPYLPPAPFDSLFGPRVRRDPRSLGVRRVPPAEAVAQREAYEASVAFLDQQLGVMMDELRRAGRLENTMVILTADHGEEFGEHRTFTHGNNLYEQVVHVPLVVWMPGRLPAGTWVETPVTGRDVAATVLDVAGVDAASAAAIPGRSLARHWRAVGASAAPDAALAEVRYARGLPKWFPVSKGTMRAARLGPLKLIRNGDGTAELYDLDADPGELTNLAGDSTFAKPGSALTTLRAMLDSLPPAERGHQPQ